MVTFPTTFCKVLVTVSTAVKVLMNEPQGTGPEKWLPEQQLNMIAGEVSAMVAAQGRALHGEVLPALRSAGIRILTYSELSSTGAERHGFPSPPPTSLYFPHSADATADQ